MAPRASHLKQTRDLCMSCPLPDCDHTDRRCLLRSGWNEYKRRLRQGRQVPASVKSAAMEWHRIEKIERTAHQSEARA